jgi:hypothetical protein
LGYRSYAGFLLLLKIEYFSQQSSLLALFISFAVIGVFVIFARSAVLLLWGLINSSWLDRSVTIAGRSGFRGAALDYFIKLSAVKPNAAALRTIIYFHSLALGH